MQTYLVLVRWTEKGIATLKDSTARLDAGRKAIEAAGGKLKHFYLLLGPYDMVNIIEAPDDATMARINLALGAKGSIRTETYRAFSEDEYRQIMSQLP